MYRFLSATSSILSRELQQQQQQQQQQQASEQFEDVTEQSKQCHAITSEPFSQKVHELMSPTQRICWGPVLILLGPPFSRKTLFLNKLDEHITRISIDNYIGLYGSIPVKQALLVWADAAPRSIVRSLSSLQIGKKSAYESLRSQQCQEQRLLALFFSDQVTFDEFQTRLATVLPEDVRLYKLLLEAVRDLLTRCKRTKPSMTTTHIQMRIDDAVDRATEHAIAKLSTAMRSTTHLIAWDDANMHPAYYYRRCLSLAKKNGRIVRFVRWGQELPSVSLKRLLQRNIWNFLRTGRYTSVKEVDMYYTGSQLMAQKFRNGSCLSHSDIANHTGYHMDHIGRLIRKNQAKQLRDDHALNLFDCSTWHSDWAVWTNDRQIAPIDKLIRQLKKEYSLRKKEDTLAINDKDDVQDPAQQVEKGEIDHQLDTPHQVQAVPQDDIISIEQLMLDLSDAGDEGERQLDAESPYRTINEIDVQFHRRSSFYRTETEIGAMKRRSSMSFRRPKSVINANCSKSQCKQQQHQELAQDECIAPPASPDHPVDEVKMLSPLTRQNSVELKRRSSMLFRRPKSFHIVTDSTIVGDGGEEDTDSTGIASSIKVTQNSLNEYFLNIGESWNSTKPTAAAEDDSVIRSTVNTNLKRATSAPASCMISWQQLDEIDSEKERNTDMLNNTTGSFTIASSDEMPAWLKELDLSTIEEHGDEMKMTGEEEDNDSSAIEKVASNDDRFTFFFEDLFAGDECDDIDLSASWQYAEELLMSQSHNSSSNRTASLHAVNPLHARRSASIQLFGSMLGSPDSETAYTSPASSSQQVEDLALIAPPTPVENTPPPSDARPDIAPLAPPPPPSLSSLFTAVAETSSLGESPADHENCATEAPKTYLLEVEAQKNSEGIEHEIVEQQMNSSHQSTSNLEQRKIQENTIVSDSSIHSPNDVNETDYPMDWIESHGSDVILRAKTLHEPSINHYLSLSDILNENKKSYYKRSSQSFIEGSSLNIDYTRRESSQKVRIRKQLAMARLASTLSTCSPSSGTALTDSNCSDLSQKDIKQLRRCSSMPSRTDDCLHSTSMECGDRKTFSDSRHRSKRSKKKASNNLDSPIAGQSYRIPFPRAVKANTNGNDEMMKSKSHQSGGVRSQDNHAVEDEKEKKLEMKAVDKFTSSNVDASPDGSGAHKSMNSDHTDSKRNPGWAATLSSKISFWRVPKSSNDGVEKVSRRQLFSSLARRPSGIVPLSPTVATKYSIDEQADRVDAVSSTGESISSSSSFEDKVFDFDASSIEKGLITERAEVKHGIESSAGHPFRPVAVAPDIVTSQDLVMPSMSNFPAAPADDGVKRRKSFSVRRVQPVLPID